MGTGGSYQGDTLSLRAGAEGCLPGSRDNNCHIICHHHKTIKNNSKREHRREVVIIRVMAMEMAWVCVCGERDGRGGGLLGIWPRE